MKKNNLNNIITLIILYLLGAVYLIIAFNYKINISSFLYFDWKVQNGFNTFLKYIIEMNEFPYHGSFYDISNIITKPSDMAYDFPVRYFAIGISYTPITLPFLKIISLNSFTILNHILAYSFGFLGMLLWKNKFKLNSLCVILYFFLILFNGAVLSKIFVGHLIFTGFGQYFYPIIFFILYKILYIYPQDGYKKNKYIIYLSLSLLFLSSFSNIISIFHILLGIVILNIIFFKRIKDFLIIYLFSILILCYWWLPTINFSIYLETNTRVMNAGFGFYNFVNNEINIIDHDKYSNILIKILFHLKNIIYQFYLSLVTSFSPHHDGNWEWGFFIGRNMLIIILLFFLYDFCTSQKKIDYRYLIFFLILTLLSTSIIFQKLNFFLNYIFGKNFSIPDRLPTRIFQFEMYILILIFIIGINRYMQEKLTKNKNLLLKLIIFFSLIPLMINALKWLPFKFYNNNFLIIEKSVRNSYAPKIYDFPKDFLYIKLVNIGFCITLFTIIMFVIYFIYCNKKVR